MKKVEETYFLHLESHIPAGCYCYGENGVCPFWDIDESKPRHENGYCHYLKMSDYETNHEGGSIVDIQTGEEHDLPYIPYTGLLWDRVKECGINDEEE